MVAVSFSVTLPLFLKEKPDFPTRFLADTHVICPSIYETRTRGDTRTQMRKRASTRSRLTAEFLGKSASRSPFECEAKLALHSSDRRDWRSIYDLEAWNVNA